MRAAMRPPAFHRRMARLALAAMLLLACVPTLGRLLAGPASQDGGGWAQLCTVAGLQQVQLPGLADPFAPPPPSQPDWAMPDHCPYCPLLQGLVPLVAPTVVAAVRPAPPLQPMHATPADPPDWWPTGLGSRGPPLFS